MATAAIVGGIASLAAGGLSYYSNMEQAADTKAYADYNAKVQQQVAARQAEINEALYRSAMNQSKAYDNEATATMLAAREQMRREREEKLRFMATQQAAFAAGGVLPEGSPIADLTDTAIQFERQQNDTFKTADEKARSLEYQGYNARYNATMQNEVNKLNTSATLANIKSTKAAAYSTATGQQYQAYGTLLTSVASASRPYATNPGSPLAKLA